MTGYKKQFCVEVITSEQRVVGVNAVYVSFPATDGLVGVLADRAPMVAAMGSGPLTIQTPDGECLCYFVSGGFAQIHLNAMTIMPEICQRADTLDINEIKDQIALIERQAAEQKTPNNSKALAVLRAKLKLARKIAGAAQPH